MNNVFGEPWIIRHTNYFSDPSAGPDELLNDATEWLHYAYNSLKLLAELVDERSSIDVHRLPIMLEGIAAFVDMGTRCATQAHMRMRWQQVRAKTEACGLI
ncbi:hypothetical protein ABZR86_17595 [Dyella marensis]|uniref:Uncharacterized protein n=1 Tax=Dyella marensis TaxID=500610 RepID=A0A1I2IYZ7_9GAMM|nr:MULTISPECIES: hypothetical protein [Dyella]SFF47514.1 hypothetical protein SAMN02799615_03732 [Dyella marensis]